MSDKIKILKQSLNKTIWFDEESHIYPYLFEESFSNFRFMLQK